ncbi:hypothetical protein PV325_006000 [Microctonus aethiopoides]|nr:hypothetical protein PV325_006000 [Microctonus aethiopoides]KAK0081931.1 hypothetical protein PV326_007431 [Microctonus aethiopoides]
MIMVINQSKCLKLNRQYRTSVLTAPLTQLSPDAGPTIIQHEEVTVYNSVNKKVRDVIDFLHEALLIYMKGGLKLLKKRYHELSPILGGDFDIQLDTDEGLRCVQFLKKELNLDFVSGNTLRPTRHGDEGIKQGFIGFGASYEVQRALRSMEIEHKFRFRNG